jgi:hypothetical protein
VESILFAFGCYTRTRYHAHVCCIFQDPPPVRAHVHFGQKSANQFDISETQNSTDGPSNDGGVHGVCPSSATSCVFRTISAKSRQTNLTFPRPKTRRTVRGHGVCSSSATSCVFRTISAHIEAQLSYGPTDSSPMVLLTLFSQDAVVCREPSRKRILLLQISRHGQLLGACLFFPR